MSLLHSVSVTTAAELVAEPFGNGDRDQSRRAGHGLEYLHHGLGPGPQDPLGTRCHSLDLLAERPRPVLVEVENNHVRLQTLGLEHDPLWLALQADHIDAVLL